MIDNYKPFAKINPKKMKPKDREWLKLFVKHIQFIKRKSQTKK